MYLTQDELLAIGFASVGKNLQISNKCSFYRISGSIGDNTRIDDFCILKGHIDIGSYVHICAYCSISGAWDKVTIADFVTLSNRVSVFTGSDDFRESRLGGTSGSEIITGPVSIGLSALIGAHVVILPNSRIGDGGRVRSMWIVNNRTYVPICDVEKIRELAKEFRTSENTSDHPKA